MSPSHEQSVMLESGFSSPRDGEGSVHDRDRSPLHRDRSPVDRDRSPVRMVTPRGRNESDGSSGGETECLSGGSRGDVIYNSNVMRESASMRGKEL